MPLACLSCTQDNSNPCFGTLIEFTVPQGSTITETDSVKIKTPPTNSSTGLLEIAPFINQNSSDDYYYQFNIILNGVTYNFVIFKQSNTTWELARNNDNVYTTWATITSPTTVDCIQSLNSWTFDSSNAIPNFNIFQTFTTVLSAPTNNEDDCTPPINVPISVSGKSIPTRIDTLYKCLDVKGTEYLNKLKGGIPCSNLELTKLSLIIELLKKRNCETALPCLYNRREFNVTLYKGDFCSDINAVAGNTVTISGNFIGYEGANFTTSCAPIPAYDYIDPEPVCDGCPPGYNGPYNINSQEVCTETSSISPTISPSTANTAQVNGGSNATAYNQGGLNLLRPININTITLPITFSGTANGLYTFKDGNNSTLQGDTDSYEANGTNYPLYSKQGSDGYTPSYQFVQANNPLFNTRTSWSNPTSISQGMLNYSGVWLNANTADCTGTLEDCDNNGNNITIYRCLNIPQSEGQTQYLLGLSADDAIKIDIKGTGFGDGETFVEMIRLSTTSLQHQDGFIWYHVIPININPGSYTLRIRGYNYAIDAAISVDIFKMNVADFKQNFCNNNLPAFSSPSTMQSIIGNTFPTGNVVNASNFSTSNTGKRAVLFNSTNCIFSLGSPTFSGNLINQTVYTQAVNYSCPVGAELDYCANFISPSCSTLTDTIPYYNCCDTGTCQDKFEGLSNKIIHVEYNPALDVSTLHLESDFPTGPGNTCINYCISYSPTTETYLETFLNYIGKECSSCINKVELNNSYSNFDTVDKVPPVPQQGLKDQSGGSITLENGFDIKL